MLIKSDPWEIEERNALDMYTLHDPEIDGIPPSDGTTTLVFYPEYLYTHRYSTQEGDNDTIYTTDFADRIYRNGITGIRRHYTDFPPVHFVDVYTTNITHQFLLSDYHQAQLLSLLINNWRNQ